MIGSAFMVNNLGWWVWLLVALVAGVFWIGRWTR
jgi:hypothetical protein